MKRFVVAIAVAVLLAAARTTPIGPGQSEIQVPLDHGPPNFAAQPSRYLIVKVGEDVCEAGSKQWSGSVNVSEGNALFFWFFESRNIPKDDPIIVWIDGGPGISSMMGLFLQAGPCSIQRGANRTRFNPHSWTDFAHMIYVDNPAGVGFSTSATGGPDNMEDAARDMNAFFRIFFTEMFPQFSTNSLHIAGESFGGHWVPSFVTHISKRQRLDVPGTFSGTIDSIILLDAVVSYMTSGPGASYGHFCSPGSRVKFNQTACQAMAATAPECDFLSRQCTDKYDVHICKSAFEYCSNVHARWYNEYGPDLPDPYDDRHVCDLDAFACGSFDMRFVGYLNTDEVKRGLGVDTAFEYKVFNAAINRAWGERAAIAVPTTREVSYILDDTATRVLVVNGNNDIIVDTSGQKRVFDDLIPWKGQAPYRLRRFADWFWPRGSPSGDAESVRGGEMKSLDKLTFVSVDEAGHLPSITQPEAVAFVIKCWAARERDEACLQFEG